MKIVKAFMTVDGELFNNQLEAIQHEQSPALKRFRLTDKLGLDFIEFWLTSDIDMSSKQYGRDLYKTCWKEIGDVSLTLQSFYWKLRELCKMNGWKYKSSGVGVARKIHFEGYVKLNFNNNTSDSAPSLSDYT